MQESQPKMESKISRMKIDEFSLRLGVLQEGHETLSERCSVMDNKLDKIIDKLTLMNGSIGKAHNRMDEITDPVDGDLTVAYLGATDWVETKKRAKWIIGIGALTGTAGGFSLSKFFAGLFG
jgi:hypothetical protein